MTTIVGNLFEINGVISTDKTVMQNLNTIATAAGAWISYDIAEGKWGVVINAPNSVVATFDDSNIIGGINISGTGVNDLYNTVSIEYPHKDLRDQTDYIDYDVETADLFPNEITNKLNISIDCVNNPVQAQYIAVSELKQSRLDKIIQFRTDYSKIGLKAGDIIEINSDVYGYTAKKFRITKLDEDDSDVLAISITALEYDEDIYDTSGLVRKERKKKTGIVPKSANSSLSEADYLANANSISFAFQATASTTAVASAFKAFAGLTPFGGNFTPHGDPPYSTLGFAGNQSSYVEVYFVLKRFYRSVTFYCQTPVGTYDFFTRASDGTVRLVEGFYAFMPSRYEIFKDGTKMAENTSDWQTQNCTFPLYNLNAGTYRVKVTPLPTYDLNQRGVAGQPENLQLQIYPGNYTVAPQTSGGGFTITGLAIL